MDLRSRYPPSPDKTPGSVPALLPWHVAAKAQHLPRRADSARDERTSPTRAGSKRGLSDAGEPVQIPQQLQQRMLDRRRR